MTTVSQIAANRKNALLSTGPRTPEGKAIVSKNSLVHGFRSRDLLLADECQEELEELTARFGDELKPVGELEHILVGRIIACVWRLSRAIRIESLFLDRVIQMAKGDEYWQKGDGWGHLFQWCGGTDASAWQNLINKYEVSIERSLYRTLKELRLLQGERRKRVHQEAEVVEAEMAAEFG